MIRFLTATRRAAAKHSARTPVAYRAEPEVVVYTTTWCGWCRKTLEFLINEDKDSNGLLEGSQHNTYDINFYGPNTMVGSLYLAALRAAEEMATELGEKDFAARCRRIFESGKKLKKAVEGSQAGD